MNYSYVLKHQTPYNNEVTSVTSEPPIAMQKSAGGMEATEVTSLPCGADAPENDEIIAASSALHNQLEGDEGFET